MNKVNYKLSGTMLLLCFYSTQISSAINTKCYFFNALFSVFVQQQKTLLEFVAFFPRYVSYSSIVFIVNNVQQNAGNMDLNFIFDKNRKKKNDNCQCYGHRVASDR